MLQAIKKGGLWIEIVTICEFGVIHTVQTKLYEGTNQWEINSFNEDINGNVRKGHQFLRGVALFI